MDDIKLVPHDTNWWILNGKVRQGPYVNFALASRIALAEQHTLQRVVVLNQAGEAIMYWPKAVDRIAVVSIDEESGLQSD